MEEARISLEETEIRNLYQQLIDGWNNRSAENIADLFAENGELIGFDGTHIKGTKEIISYFQSIFAKYPHSMHVGKVREVNIFAYKVGVLRAIAGVMPQDQSDLGPVFNTHHTLVAKKMEDTFNIVFFKGLQLDPELFKEM